MICYENIVDIELLRYLYILMQFLTSNSNLILKCSITSSSSQFPTKSTIHYPITTSKRVTTWLARSTFNWSHIHIITLLSLAHKNTTITKQNLSQPQVHKNGISKSKPDNPLLFQNVSPPWLVSILIHHTSGSTEDKRAVWQIRYCQHHRNFGLNIGFLFSWVCAHMFHVCVSSKQALPKNKNSTPSNTKQ